MHNPIRVLLVDDEPGDAHLTRRALKKVAGADFEVEAASTLTEALQRLQSARFDVLLLDLGLPEGYGLETLEAVRRANPDIPLVVLTGLSDEQMAMEALNRGAQDYLTKGRVDPDGLRRSVRYAIHRQQLVKKLTETNGLLEQQNQRLAEFYEHAHEFVDNVSHEFRTPLTVLREFCSLTRDGLAGPLTERQTEYLDIMRLRIDDLAFLVDDMLDISRVEAGLLSIWRRPTPLTEVIEHTRLMLQHRATAKGVQLNLDVAPDLPAVYADSEKIGRVLINLCVNAIKFTPEGGQVAVTARHNGATDAVEVVVRDTGVGISRENLERIFQRFQQVGSRVTAAKGFGLGLSIAQQLVQLHYGQLHVESEVGSGSTFSFTLPVAKPAALLRRFLDHTASRDPDQSLCMLRVTAAGNQHGGEATPVIDEFLQNSIRNSDFVYQVGPGHWVLLLVCHRDDIAEIRKRLHREWTENRGQAYGTPLPNLVFADGGGWHVEQLDELLRQLSLGAITPQSSDEAPRILLVDDDREVVAGLRTRLEAAGFQTLSAHDGRRGVEAARDSAPDAILLDVRMPDMDGLAALEELKRDDATSAIPVIMLSACLVDQQRSLDKGARFFLQKPYDPPTVISAVESTLAENQS